MAQHFFKDLNELASKRARCIMGNSEPLEIFTQDKDGDRGQSTFLSKVEARKLAAFIIDVVLDEDL